MPHEEFYRELAQCQGSGEFVGYHMWGDEPGSFLVGVVEELSPTRVVFRDVDPRGAYQPIPHAVSLRLIHSIDRRTHYLWRLQTLHELGVPDPIEEKDARKTDDVRALLKVAAGAKFIVRVWTSAHEANDYLVSSVGDEVVVLLNVTDGGPVDGRSMVRLKRIVRVRVGRDEVDDTRTHRHWSQHGFPRSRGDDLPGL